MTRCDYLIVGAGITGCVIAHELASAGKTVVVIDKRDHIGGNCYTRRVGNINVHEYGAHIFRTNDAGVWSYIRRFAEFNNFVNTPIAVFGGKAYNLPFNMNTFTALWPDVITPEDARRKIREQCVYIDHAPRNIEEYALSTVGTDIYEKLIRGYTEKQWGRKCTELPASIMRRIPVRFTYDNNYFSAKYQGIPVGGYTRIFSALLSGCEVVTGVRYRDIEHSVSAGSVIYTGAIDEYFDFCFGHLDYRSLRFEHETYHGVADVQGVAVMNYTGGDVPYTRTIEHKHFDRVESDFTVVTKEYPAEFTDGGERYYPIEDAKNKALLEQYSRMASTSGVVFAGRLGTYRYMDMQDAITAALSTADRLIHV